MKYLVRAKRNLVPMEPKMAIGLVQAAKQYNEAELAAGRIDLHYLHGNGNGGFVIANADSHEEVYDRLLEFPLYVFMDWEVMPLVDWSHGYDQLAELFQKMAAMA